MTTTKQTNTTSTTPDDEFLDIGTGRINDLLSGALYLTEDTDGILDAVHDAFSTIADRVSNQRVNVKTIALQSNEQSPASRLAYPTVLLVVGIKDHVVVMPYFIVPARTAEFDALKVVHGQEEIFLPRHPSEAYDSRAIADFTAVVSKDYNIPAEKIHFQEVKCILKVSPFLSGNPEEVMKEASKLLNPAIRIAAASLLVTHTGASKDVSLAKGVNPANSHLAITYRQLDALQYDEDDQPVGSNGSIQATVRVERTQGDNSTSVNRLPGSYTVGKVQVRASVVHASGQIVMNPALLPPNTPRPPMFTPQLILDDMSINGDPSPANMVLMLASVNPLINPEIIRRMFDPKDIGYLNTRANITGDGKPFSEKDVRANYPQVWQQFFTNSVIVSMSMRLGSLSSLFGGMFLRNSLNSKHKGETKAAIENLFGISLEGLHNNVRYPNIELHAVGTYKADNNQIRPLSDIDLLWLIRNAGNRPQLIDQWAMSSDGSQAPLVSLAMKMNVLRTVTNGSMKVTDRALMFTFTSDYLHALNLALNNAQVTINTNLSTLTGMEQQRWAPYMTANNSLSFTNFVPFTGTNFVVQGNTGYHYGAYVQAAAPQQAQYTAPVYAQQQGKAY